MRHGNRIPKLPKLYVVFLVLLSFVIILCSGASARSQTASTRTDSSYKTIALRYGTTSQPNNFRTQGFSFGKYYRESPIFKDGVGVILWALDSTFGILVPSHLRPINAKSSDVGFELALTEFDDSQIEESQLDLSLVPKVRYFPEEDRDYYLSLGLGAGYNRLKSENNPDVDLALGSDLAFAPELGVGIRWTWNDHVGYVSYLFTHRSNADLAQENVGINAHLVQIQTKF